jgi:hypothetical protein
MPQQRNQHYRAIPFARANYDRLCRKHGMIPTPADVDAIRRAIGPVSVQPTIQNRFEAGLLFFLSRSAVDFEDDSLLIGWMYEEDDERTRREVWFKPSSIGTRSLCHIAGGLWGSLYSPEGSVCDEWHPVIFDIVDPNENTLRAVQYAYFKACIKLLQAAVPPPSIERSRPVPVDSARTTPATLNSNGSHQSASITPSIFPAPNGRQNSPVVDLTASDEEVVIKPEVVPTHTPINRLPTSSTQVEERIQEFREKLDKKEVKELQQMFEKPLPSWIRELAEDVLQKKMLTELDLAESIIF